MGYAEVAVGKISVLLFTRWKVIKSYSSVKFPRSNLFCLYFIEKDNWGANGTRFEEILSNLQILNSPPPLYS